MLETLINFISGLKRKSRRVSNAYLRLKLLVREERSRQLDRLLGVYSRGAGSRTCETHSVGSNPATDLKHITVAPAREAREGNGNR
jgi:hypothetical protein